MRISTPWSWDLGLVGCMLHHLRLNKDNSVPDEVYEEALKQVINVMYAAAYLLEEPSFDSFLL